MKIERTKNTIRGSIWGIVEKITGMLLPFLVRTVLIYKLGMEYLGLSSLFTSILQVLSLTELGFASATVFAMYKPIAEDDYDTVGGILYYLKGIYSLVGIIMLTIGAVLIPFLPRLINGDIPDGINIYGLYLVYLFNAASSYFFMGYKSSLLNALQCNDIISKVGFITNTALKVLQCIVLLLWSNYYVYVMLIPILTIVNNLIKAGIVNHRFSQYLIPSKIDGKLKSDIKSRIIPLMSTKLAVVLVNSADTLVISAVLGLMETAMYNNYYFIMTSVQGLIFVIHSSMLGGVGNALVVDKKEKIIASFNRLNFINFWLVSFCTVCFLCLYQPFMYLWVGDDYLLSYTMVILFSLYFYATTIVRVVVVYKDAAGIWKEDMLRSYASCFINIVLNIVSARYIGLYGVIGSSVFVNVFINPWIARTLYKTIFKESPKAFYFNLLKGFLITIVIGIVIVMICNFIPVSFAGLVIRGLICCIVVNIILFFIYRKDSDFISSKKWILEKIKNR